MANNFLALSGSVMLSGSLQMSGGDMTGNLIGTASHATYAENLTVSSLTLADLTITNTASIEYLNVVYQSSSVIYSSGSNIFGDAPSDTQTLHGQVEIINDAHIYGALQVDGGLSGNVTGSLLGNVVGNADTATSASHALLADYAQAALSASHASNSDFAQTAISSSHALNSDYAQIAISASYSATSDLAQAAVSSSHALVSDLAQSAISASHALEADHALSSDTAISASHALLADGLNATSLTLADLVITNTASIQYLDVVYQSSSVIYSSGSNIFGDASDDTQTLHGQVEILNDAHIYGTLQVDGGISGNITGSLQGNADTATSASFASYALSSSFALSASHVVGAKDVGFQKEWHVSAGSGSDATGNGSLSKPFATLGKAFSVVGGTGEQIVVHPGLYLEATASLTRPNVSIVSANFNAGGICYFNGAITIAAGSSSTRISGLLFNNLIHSGSAGLYLDKVQVKANYTKIGSGYSEIVNSDLQATGSVQFKGGVAVFQGDKIFAPVVSGSGTALYIKDAISVVAPSAVAGGTLVLSDSQVYPAVSGSSAVTSAAGTVVYLYNTQITTTTGLPERINIGGFLGYDDVQFNKNLSTLGTSLNLRANFQSLDANNLTATGSLLGNASTATSASIANSINPSANITVAGLNIGALGNYTDDTAAAAAGVPINGVYRNGNFLVIRIA